MSNLRDIRRRIKSTEQIKQITKTMGMVASARLRKAQMRAEQARPYAAKMKQMVENLSMNTELPHPLFAQREVKKTGLVVIAADRGLCGSYNTNIFLTVDRLLTKYSRDAVELILIGRRAVSYYQQKGWTIRTQIPEWGGKITFIEMKHLAGELVHAFLNNELDEIKLIYTHYINVFSRKIVVEKFLNIEKTEAKKETLDYIYEPNAQEIFDEIIPRYCNTKIQSALHEAYASELSARIVSMRAATKNAEEMIENLTQLRNRIRQAGITREMIEIVSGQKRD